MLHSQEYSNLLGMLKCSHITEEKYNEFFFLLGMSNLNIWEELELENLAKQKFDQ